MSIIFRSKTSGYSSIFDYLCKSFMKMHCPLKSSFWLAPRRKNFFIEIQSTLWAWAYYKTTKAFDCFEAISSELSATGCQSLEIVETSRRFTATFTIANISDMIYGLLSYFISRPDRTISFYHVINVSHLAPAIFRRFFWQWHTSINLLYPFSYQSISDLGSHTLSRLIFLYFRRR